MEHPAIGMCCGSASVLLRTSSHSARGFPCEHGLFEVLVSRIVGQPDVEQCLLEFSPSNDAFKTAVLVDNNTMLWDIHDVEYVALGDRFFKTLPELIDSSLDWRNIAARRIVEALSQGGH